MSGDAQASVRDANREVGRVGRDPVRAAPPPTHRSRHPAPPAPWPLRPTTPPSSRGRPLASSCTQYFCCAPNAPGEAGGVVHRHHALQAGPSPAGTGCSRTGRNAARVACTTGLGGAVPLRSPRPPLPATHAPPPARSHPLRPVAPAVPGRPRSSTVRWAPFLPDARRASPPVQCATRPQKRRTVHRINLRSSAPSCWPPTHCSASGTTMAACHHA